MHLPAVFTPQQTSVQDGHSSASQKEPCTSSHGSGHPTAQPLRRDWHFSAPGITFSHRLLNEFPSGKWPQVIHRPCGRCVVGVQAWGISGDHAKFRGRAMRYLFRESSLWNQNVGYTLHFGKGTSLLVTAGEFSWLTNYLFWKEIQRDLLKRRWI